MLESRLQFEESIGFFNISQLFKPGAHKRIQYFLKIVHMYCGCWLRFESGVFEKSTDTIYTQILSKDVAFASICAKQSNPIYSMAKDIFFK